MWLSCVRPARSAALALLHNASPHHCKAEAARHTCTLCPVLTGLRTIITITIIVIVSVIVCLYHYVFYCVSCCMPPNLSAHLLPGISRPVPWLHAMARLAALSGLLPTRKALPDSVPVRAHGSPQRSWQRCGQLASSSVGRAQQQSLARCGEKRHSHWQHAGIGAGESLQGWNLGKEDCRRGREAPGRAFPRHGPSHGTAAPDAQPPHPGWVGAQPTPPGSAGAR